MIEAASHLLLGISLLLLGTRWLREGLQTLSAKQLKLYLTQATANRRRSLFFGFLISLLIPSSTGVAVFLAETSCSRTVSFTAMLGVVLGAQVGLTVVVHILSLPITAAAPGILVAGIWVFLFSKNQKIKLLGQCIAGLGFLFYGMGILSQAAAILRSNEHLCALLQWASDHTISLIVFSALLTILFQSSTAALGLILALVLQQIVSIESGMIAVLGVNLGLGISGCLVSLEHIESRRLAAGNLLFKVVGLLIALPLIWYVCGRFSFANFNHQILANINTLFNVGCAVIFTPFLAFFSRWIEKLTPSGLSENFLIREDNIYDPNH